MSSAQKDRIGISRRAFLKGAAVGAVGVAGAGVLSGCGQQAATPCPPAPTAEPCPECPPAAAQAPGQYAFEVPPAPIPDSEIKETVTTDVLVIGAGTSGLPAAQRAKEAGADVILIDKFITSRYGGGDNSACNSRLHKQLGITIDLDKVCLALQKYSGNFANQALVRLWADHSGEYMNWLMDIGEKYGHTWGIYQWPRPAAFDPDTEYYEEFPTCHRIDNQMNQGLILQVERDNYAAMGGVVRWETRAKQLIKEGGRIIGAIAQDKDGNYIKFLTNKAVVVATGDYGQNKDMMQKYCPNSAALAASPANIFEMQQAELREAKEAGKEPINTGDGHQMLLWVGGQMQLSPHPPMSHAMSSPFGPCPFLMVNTRGERFMNEDVSSQGLSNQLYWQPGGVAFHIADSKWAEQIPYMGVGLMKMIGEVSQADKERIESTATKADTIEDLAAAMKLPADTLKATVDRYNELCAKGHDDDYGKRVDRMFPISTPPYYIGQSSPMFLVVVGGLRTNNRLQLVDADLNVIPGVYLCGNTVGYRFHNDYPTMCPGLSHGMAGTHGYLVGTWAAQG